jgi:hypothetical protein
MPKSLEWSEIAVRHLMVSPASTRSESLNAWHAVSKSSAMKSRSERQANQVLFLVD